MSKKNKSDISSARRTITIKIVIFLTICLIVGLSFFFKTPIENFINFKYAGEQASNDIDQSGLVVHFVDVDQADAIAIKFPNNKTMLIDSGDSKEGSNTKLLNYLDNKFFAGREKVFDYLLITHSDADHVGGAVSVYEKYQVNYTFYPDVDENKTQTFKKFIDAMKNEPDSMYETNNSGDKIVEGGVVIDFYSPFYNAITNANANNQSPIMIMNFAGRKIMFTGDAGQDLEKDVLKNYSETDFDVDVLKVAHHGSRTSSCKDFLDVAKPEYAVISCGKDNKYGHPTDETLERLKSAGVKDNCLYRTDNNGNVILSISSNGVLAFATDNSTYTTVFIKWEYVAPGIIAVSFMIIFIPKKSSKHTKKSKKAKTNKNT
ncbi:MAG: ComEC/Rec2 family competence protein [Christensenellales bacterium]